MSKELETNKIAVISEGDIGTNCIICDDFIKLENPYFRASNKYVCQDCKDLIVTLKKIGWTKILKAVDDIEHLNELVSKY